jgi:hypothetical protein
MEQAPRPEIVSIPEPTNDPDGLFRTVMALKQAVEQMLGLRGRKHGGLSEAAFGGGHNTAERKATIHIMNSMPNAAIDGDLWLCKGPENSSFSIAIDGKWQKVWPP